MNQNFLRLIQSGATAEVADAVGADLALAEFKDPQGVSALLWAIYTGQIMVRDYLLTVLTARGAAFNVFEAAAIGDEAGLQSVLKADPSAVQSFSGDGWTAIHLAAAFGTPTSVAALIAGGAEVNVVSENAQRNQPLHAAMALSRNLEIVELLLRHGADANATQAGGFTPIFSAAAANRRDLAELLLAYGANPRHTSDQGKTPAEFARERGHAELAAWLDAVQA